MKLVPAVKTQIKQLAMTPRMIIARKIELIVPKSTARTPSIVANFLAAAAEAASCWADTPGHLNQTIWTTCFNRRRNRAVSER